LSQRLQQVFAPMGVSRSWAVALAVGISAAIVANLGEWGKYEVLSRLLYPAVRLLFASGLAPRVIFGRVDESDFRLPGDLLDREWLGRVGTWTPGGEDVIIATFPKSGTHLMMQMVLQIVANASDAAADFDNIHHFLTALEILSPRTLAQSKGSTDKVLTIANYRELSPFRPFLHSTHLDYDHIPKGPGARYVVMIRDPLDVLLGFHSQISKILGRMAPLPDELLGFVFRAFGGWAGWNRQWWKRRDDPNVLILFYADAVKKPTETVSEVARFLGRAADAELVARVEERCSIGYMKARGKSFEPPIMVKLLPFQKPQGTNTGMVNKGKVGRGKDMLTKETRTAMRDYCRGVLADIDFPFHELPSCM